MNKLKIFFPLTLVFLFIYSGTPPFLPASTSPVSGPGKDSLIRYLREKNMHTLNTIHDMTLTYDSLHPENNEIFRP